MNTLNMPTHEHLRLLRNGEKVLCKNCKTGIMLPVGNHEKNQYILLRFLLESVDYQLTIRRQV